MPDMYVPKSPKKPTSTSSKESPIDPNDFSLEELIANLPDLPTLPNLVQKAPLPKGSIAEVVSALDSNKDGTVQLQEYLERREDFIEVNRHLFLKEIEAIAEKNNGFVKKPDMDIKRKQLKYLNTALENLNEAIKDVPIFRGITTDIGNGITEPKTAIDNGVLTLMLNDNGEVAKKLIHELGTMKTPILPGKQVMSPSQDKTI